VDDKQRTEAGRLLLAILKAVALAIALGLIIGYPVALSCDGPRLRECREACHPFAPVADNGRAFNTFDRGTVCYCDTRLVVPEGLDP